MTTIETNTQSKADRDTPTVNPAVLQSLMNDPVKRKQLKYMQTLLNEAISFLIDDAAKKLKPGFGQTENGDAKPVQSMDMVALAAASRHAGLGVKARRALAEGIVMGALKNCNNPDWDVMDVTTDKTDEKSVLLSLLTLKLDD